VFIYRRFIACCQLKAGTIAEKATVILSVPAHESDLTFLIHEFLMKLQKYHSFMSGIAVTNISGRDGLVKHGAANGTQEA
jgi:hypothetical protein